MLSGLEFDAGTFPGEDRGFFCPAFLQFGKDYAGARDDYVYIYAPEIKTEEWEVNKPGEISLMRVPKLSLADFEAYEYFGGLNSNGEPVWTVDPSGRKPVFEDEMNGVIWNFSNKWQSEDGRNFVLIFTGKGRNDSFNSVEGNFILPDS